MPTITHPEWNSLLLGGFRLLPPLVNIYHVCRANAGKMHQIWETNMYLHSENTTPMWLMQPPYSHSHHYHQYLIRRQLQTQCHKRTFMKGTKRSIATQRRPRESKAELSGRMRREQKKREREGQLKHLGVNNKSFTSKNRDSCASGYQLMSRECLSFQETRSA